MRVIRETILDNAGLNGKKNWIMLVIREKLMDNAGDRGENTG